MLLPKKRNYEAQQSSSSDGIPSTSNKETSTSAPQSVSQRSAHDVNDPQNTTNDATNATNRNDIYSYVNRVSNLAGFEKFDLLSNTWKPEASYSFPCNKESKRRFQYAWLTRFPWLAHSASANGGFCVNCVLFGGETTHNASKLQRLMTAPLTPSASSVQKLTQHGQTSKVHQTATLRATEFKRTMERKTVAIDEQLNNKRREIIEMNRARLRAIVDAIIII